MALFPGIQRGRVINSLLCWSDLMRLPERPLSLPLTIWVENTTACNLRCEMCYKSAVDTCPPNLHLPPEFMQRLLPEARSACFSLLLGFGEPLLSPNYFPWLEQLIGIGCTTTTSFNGLVLNEERARKVIESGVAQVSFSVDATTAETYSRIRKGGDWDTLLTNIRRFMRFRAEQGSELPYPRLSFVMLRDNLHEIPQCADFAKSLGIEFIAVMDPVFYSEEMAERFSFSDAQQTQAIDQLRRRCEQLGVFLDYYQDSSYIYLDSKGIPTKPGKMPPAAKYQDNSSPLLCPMLYTTLFIRGDGKVAPCCYLYEKVVGDLNISSVTDIWRGAELARMRRAIREGDFPPGCRICQRLMLRNRREIMTKGRVFVRRTWQASRERRRTGYAAQTQASIV